ncbi:hypothetical protein [Cohnella phaseoli]|uniref:Uncharacterized protein n=1 Tax=Cohnella phaseoli TaxID=456490 RepID=A0A3D9KQU7_9BACL|nr:hypothetical protein [Cohnella phaseoli]RED89073.1 hypothetical protein DFP98_10144 [Cohnella phaseoli]
MHLFNWGIASLHENTYGTNFSDIYGKLKMAPYSDKQFLAKQFTESRTLFTFASKNKLQLMEMHFLPE